MDRCLELANEARQRGEPGVGCVVVRDGLVVGEAAESVRESLDPAGHAEILALRRACQAVGSLDLSGCELYTNVEPCLMCSHAIRECGVSAVYILNPVEGIGGVTSAFPILTDETLPYEFKPPRVVWLDRT
jgi:tRNA(Arg) A34 adenosine deaminase TadA